MVAMKPLDRVVVTVHIESFNGTPGTASEVRNFTTGTIDTQVEAAAHEAACKAVEDWYRRRS
jgi:hypothetical protein